MKSSYKLYAASLHIDVENYNNKGQKEKTYISDEKDLSALFDKSVSDRINKIKIDERKSYTEDNGEIFIKDIVKEDIVKYYQKDLFISDGFITDSHNIGISLRESHKDYNVGVFLCFSMAFIFMMLSVISVFRARVGKRGM